MNGSLMYEYGSDSRMRTANYRPLTAVTDQNLSNSEGADAAASGRGVQRQQIAMPLLPRTEARQASPKHKFVLSQIIQKY